MDLHRLTIGWPLYKIARVLYNCAWVSVNKPFKYNRYYKKTNLTDEEKILSKLNNLSISKKAKKRRKKRFVQIVKPKKPFINNRRAYKLRRYCKYNK